ncbi:MAG TPA: heparan-alpha-glucosaminide N-acetyltransferase domain-containing protein [Bacteroidales bacterium]|nr:heparan-alpha-glucosaminide N-acetyltransferase domain-containing protein [Bacteroidales bacterium]
MNSRIKSIDITRGLVMVIMALDHVREFWHKTSMTVSPTDLEKTTTALFFTRWITHLCAPSFVFLAGASAYLSFRKYGDISFSRRFLLTRGIWLVMLEFTLINFALWFDIHFRLVILEVIAAIGFSFIILSFLLKLKPAVIGTIGLIIIFSHNLLQSVPIPDGKFLSIIFSSLFRPGMTELTGGHAFFSAYPVIPWTGIMLTGFGCGIFLDKQSKDRRKSFLIAGLAALAVFLIFRFINLYGDPAPWSVQKNQWFTFLSFINVTKYPPSMLFSLLFTGFACLFIAFFENTLNKITDFLSVFGKVPFFYFVIHLCIIHALMFVMLFIQGYGLNDLVFGVFRNGRPETGGGVSLAVVYIIWALVVAGLYPVCRWYSNYRSGHPEKWWLRYL